MKFIKKVLHSLSFFINKIIVTRTSLREFKKNESWIQNSYYPELCNSRKKESAIFKEQRKYIFKYSRPNGFYFLYGFDIEGFRNPLQYVDYLTVFRTRRDYLNRMPNSPFIVLRDKLLFGAIAEGLGINTPHNIAVYDNSHIFTTAHPRAEIKYSDLINQLGDIDVFCKLVNGECANGVFSLRITNGNIFVDDEPISIELLKKRLNGGRFIFQQRINQHEDMNAVFQNSINTIRLVTVYDKQKDSIEIFSAVLRVGAGKNHVDNWAAGGLSIGIDTELGVLRKYGFYKPGFGTKTESHPNSGVVFENYKIPYFEESLNTAKRFHYFLKGIHSIGWDIAITPNGPCIIEGNDNWEISLMQACNGGLKEKFDLLF